MATETPSVASSAATRRSHHSASSRPPPRHSPSMLRSPLDSVVRVGPLVRSLSARSPVGRSSWPSSRPAQKSAVTVEEATEALSSASNSSNAVRNWAEVSLSTAFSDLRRSMRQW